MATMTDAARLTLLEERYAHLQRHSTEQDRVILELSETVAKLRKEVGGLRAQRASDSEAGERPDERPPHY